MNSLSPFGAINLMHAVVGASAIDDIISASLAPVNGLDAYRNYASVFSDVIEVSEEEYRHMLNAPRKVKKRRNREGTLVSPRSRRGRRERRAKRQELRRTEHVFKGLLHA